MYGPNLDRGFFFVGINVVGPDPTYETESRPDLYIGS